MAQTVDAIYEHGVLRLLEPLQGVAERRQVRVTVELAEPYEHPLAGCIGIMPDQDADEMLRIIDDAFERVNPDDWR